MKLPLMLAAFFAIFAGLALSTHGAFAQSASCVEEVTWQYGRQPLQLPMLHSGAQPLGSTTVTTIGQCQANTLAALLANPTWSSPARVCALTGWAGNIATVWGIGSVSNGLPGTFYRVYAYTVNCVSPFNVFFDNTIVPGVSQL